MKRLLLITTLLSICEFAFSQDVLNGHEYVDLGLPSGTLWATCNIGANSPEEYGDYFAWAEIETKSTSSWGWGNYKYCKGTQYTLTKYCTNSNYGTQDNLILLEDIDDAAKQVLGDEWSMPTVEQCNELMSECEWTYIDGETNQICEGCDVIGYKITGKNSNSIFLPLAGLHEGHYNGAKSHGFYWVNKIDTSYYGGRYALCLHLTTYAEMSGHIRCDGMTIRPVRSNKVIYVQSISFEKENFELYIGEQVAPELNILPDDATDRSVVWKSSDESIAKVSDGVIEALAIGETTITATTTDGSNLSASCLVTVKNKIATSISLNSSSENIVIGNTCQLSATVLPDDIPNKSVSWSSNNTTIASVDQNGYVTANNVGEATITATTTDGSNLSASCKVTVTPILATSITIDKKTAEIYIGDNTTLTATVFPEDATYKSVTWRSSDESIATVANGVVQGVSAGTVTITASTTDGSNLSATCLVTVKSRVATSITLNSSSEDIVVGNSCQLSATVLPEDISNKGVTWSSNNTSIASVDQNGLVAANNVGETTITATTTDGSNLSASCKVTVTPILATNITLNKTTAEVNVGGSTSLTATILPETATYKTVTWKSSDETVATVTGGVIVGKSPGTAIVSASTTDGSQLTATCTVTVLDILATMLSLDKEALELYVDESATLSAAVYPDNTTNKAVTWTSSNASVATVADGVVTAKSEGTATITAKTTDGSNLSATCQIIVRRHPQTITWDQDLSTVVSGGELIKLEATASSGLDITFSSSDENIASIFMFSDGVYLNAYGEGSVDITASQPGNKYYAPASMTKTVNVVDPSGIRDILSDGKYTIYTINGFKVGTYSADEYKKLKLAKGVYVINGFIKVVNI